MKKRYFHILIFLGFIILLSSTRVAAQTAEKDIKKITIESFVKDENGNPIKGATIYGDEGATISKSDASGKFVISFHDKTDLLIESDGYESVIFRAGEYKNLQVFSLKSSKFYYGEKDIVNVAFGKVKRGDLVNSVSVINPQEILQYDNIQDISEALSGRVPGLLGSSNIRGIGSPLYIVDGLPRDIGTINLAEVQQITVLKDINSSILYGNNAVNGVVIVTTKRGQAYKKQLSVTGYYGISKPTALPKYLSSADYAGLYNEALINDGLLPQSDSASISNYRNGNSYRYPNVDYYSKTYLKTIKPFFRVMTELSGGNNVSTYYANIGWDQTESLLNFGAGKSAKQNRFNVRGNVDMKINSWIKASLDAVAVLDNKQDQVSDYWSQAATLKPNLFSPLIPISLMEDPENVLVKARKNDVNGIYLLGGTSSWLKNPIADGYSGGVTENIQRTFSFNNRIDFNLDRITKGLAFHTNISFDLYTLYDQTVSNNYSVYEPVWNPAADSIVSLNQYGSDNSTGTQNVSGNSYIRRFGFHGLLDYDRYFGDDHHVTGSLLGYASEYKVQNDFQGTKSLNLGLRIGYSFKERYMVDFSSAYVNSVKLPKGNRGAFSPSLGLAWVISSEPFLSSVSAIDYLKLRITGGIMNSDAGIPGFYYYDNKYQTSGSYSWYDGGWANSGTISSYGGNNNLAYERRNEVNLGFEGLFFKKMIGLEANFFKSKYSDQITKPQTAFPSFYTNFIPYKNFDENTYWGEELGLSFNRSIGDISFTIGANGLFTNSKVTKKDEVYLFKYQNRTGHPVDALFGLVADGLFKDQADIDGHAVQALGLVKPGDIKYIDQNGDKIINSDDEIQIGRSTSPFSYGLNLKVTYKYFTLSAKGIGRKGADSYISGDYYWVDGNDKYTEYVLNRWTNETKETATYPRLSSMTNTNNFRNSTFWQYKNNYFTLDRVQLTYNIPDAMASKLRMKKLSFFIDGSNLFTISKQKKIKDLSVSGEPYYRSFSLGIKMVF